VLTPEPATAPCGLAALGALVLLAQRAARARAGASRPRRGSRTRRPPPSPHARNPESTGPLSASRRPRANRRGRRDRRPATARPRRRH
jgi:hypothetical protein